jgi:hypothetical protein
MSQCVPITGFFSAARLKGPAARVKSVIVDGHD